VYRGPLLGHTAMKRPFDLPRSHAAATRSGAGGLRIAAADRDPSASFSTAGAETSPLVQLLPCLDATSSGPQARPAGQSAHTIATAMAGVRGMPGPLPFLERIQASFGRHDVTHARAHMSPQASRSARAIGAAAYTFGRDVAFDCSPSLFTAAHEAAHVVQQAGGVRPRGGLDHASDPWERHADRVAERVVAGRSAEDLLSPVAPARGAMPVGAAVVQCEPAKAPPKVKQFGPTVLGSVFAAYIRLALGDQIGEAKIAAKVVRVKTVTDDAFKIAWSDYCEREGAPAQSPPDSLNGFVDKSHPDGPLGFIRQAAGLGTIVHETVHQLAFADFSVAYGRAMNEGTTELFTRIVLAKNKAGIERTAYPDEYKAMLRLQAICGLEKLAKFYFGGDASEVIAAVGANKFSLFTAAMAREEPDQAIAAL